MKADGKKTLPLYTLIGYRGEAFHRDIAAEDQAQ